MESKTDTGKTMTDSLMLSPNALTALRKRYLRKDNNGIIIETPEELFKRVAGFVASAEPAETKIEAEDIFYKMMSSLEFLPNTPTLINAGKPELLSLSGCFVLPVGDSMEGIFDAVKHAAMIHKAGGGTGFSFSRLRPSGDRVGSTQGVSSGPISFMTVFDSATETVKQGGARRGANMGILRVDHPDILDFIQIKRKSGELENFNISVAVTDSFMNALYNDREYDLLNPRTNKAYRKMKAKTVFDEIVMSAWETGDPGIVFIDVMNRFNPTPNIGKFESTNPCGEQPLLPYEACVLGSINLNKYIKKGNETKIDFEMLSDDIMTAVRFLDDSIDVNKYPMPDIEIMHKGNRKIGLGVMGWADLLISLEVQYNSMKAFKLAEDLMKFIRDRARLYSVELAKERGVFPNFRGSIYDAPDMPRVRNATTTTIAPTGTLSIIADCSSGIEPLFALAYRRLILDTELLELNKQFFDVAENLGFHSEALKERVMQKGMLRGARGVPKKIKKIFKTAHEISYKDHIEMQVSFQRFTDNAVSKTINMPRNAKKEDVARAFFLAYEKGCKGLTIFRYGSQKTGTLVRFSDTD